MIVVMIVMFIRKYWGHDVIELDIMGSNWDVPRCTMYPKRFLGLASSNGDPMGRHEACIHMYTHIFI